MTHGEDDARDLNNQLAGYLSVMREEAIKLGVSKWYLTEVLWPRIRDTFSDHRPVHPEKIEYFVKAIGELIPVDTEGDRTTYDRTVGLLYQLIAPADAAWRLGGSPDDLH